MPAKADVKLEKLLRYFATGAALQTTSLLAEGPKSLSSSTQPWKKHMKRAVSRGLSFSSTHLVYIQLLRLHGMPEFIRKLIASAGAGWTAPPLISAFVFAGGILPPLLRVPLLKPVVPVWWAWAALFNYQLWAQHHHYHPSYSRALNRAAGLPANKAVYHRSKTREMFPCNHPTLGIHPGEDSCARAAVTAVMHGVPELIKMYAVIYGLRYMTGKWKGDVPTLLKRYVRSVLMMAVQVHVGRAAYCMNSRLSPKKFLWWLGPIMGIVASNGLWLEYPDARADVVTFNSANAMLTLVTQLGLGKTEKQAAHMALFCIGSAVSGRLFR